jgi:two-component system phosphate regulon response regulator PhoB
LALRFFGFFIETELSQFLHRMDMISNDNERMSHRVLIIEDEPELAESLSYYLGRKGYEVEIALNAATGREILEREPPDILVLDVMLPDESGISVCRWIRAHRSLRELLVLFVSARGEEFDRIIAFEIGADDYMIKPFSLKEFELRVQALLRSRQSRPTTQVLNVGELTIDELIPELRVNGKIVELTATEFRVLLRLVQARGRTLTRDQLLQAAWPDPEGRDGRVVDTYIKRLRQKLGSAGDLISTRRGIGYIIKNESP